jgi:hypothetical protein
MRKPLFRRRWAWAGLIAPTAFSNSERIVPSRPIAAPPMSVDASRKPPMGVGESAGIGVNRHAE